MKWRRLRKVVSGQSEEKVDESKKQILKALQKLSEQGSIDLRYLDGTGFCLTPDVPYAWQEPKEKKGIESKQSKRLNVLGLLNRKNELYSYIFERSEIVIKFLDLYVQKINRLTVVVLDNAPIHKSKAFQKKIAEWRSAKNGNILVAYLFSATKLNRNFMEIYKVWMDRNPSLHQLETFDSVCRTYLAAFWRSLCN